MIHSKLTLAIQNYIVFQLKYLCIISPSISLLNATHPSIPHISLDPLTLILIVRCVKIYINLLIQPAESIYCYLYVSGHLESGNQVERSSLGIIVTILAVLSFLAFFCLGMGSNEISPFCNGMSIDVIIQVLFKQPYC